MTENEAIELLRSMQNPKQDYADVVCAPAFCTGFRFVYPEPEDYAIEEAIKALKEIQQYREIGTVEECREAVEKQNPKKPKEILRHRGGFETLHCPNCNTDYQMDNRYTITEGYCPACGKLIDSAFRNYCGNCGQAIDENLEGMEDRK